MSEQNRVRHRGRKDRRTTSTAHHMERRATAHGHYWLAASPLIGAPPHYCTIKDHVFTYRAHKRWPENNGRRIHRPFGRPPVLPIIPDPRMAHAPDPGTSSPRRCAIRSPGMAYWHGLAPYAHPWIGHGQRPQQRYGFGAALPPPNHRARLCGMVHSVPTGQRRRRCAHAGGSCAVRIDRINAGGPPRSEVVYQLATSRTRPG
jgi:hypothetical protein